MARPRGSESQPEAYQPPETMPAHPADVAEGRYVRRFVEEKRAQRISWQNIARMLGKSEAQLRKDHGWVG